MQPRVKLVVSDLHMGTGNQKGSVNVFEDFSKDDAFADFLSYYSEGEYAGYEVELILNGDVFDMLKVPVDGAFSGKVTERQAIAKLDACMEGHPVFVSALRKWLRDEKHSLTLIPGNHDIEMMWPGAGERFRDWVARGAARERVVVWQESDTYFLPEGIQIHHGHQFEIQNSFDYRRLFVTPPPNADGTAAEPYIPLPWGSRFVLFVVNPLRHERPYVDHVRPFSRFVVLGLLFDTRFILKLLWRTLRYFVRNRVEVLAAGQAGGGIARWWRRFQHTIESTATLFPALDDYAEFILRNVRGVHTVIMGHTHFEVCRVYEQDKVYLNTGTWVNMISLDVPKLGRQQRECYALIEYPETGRPVTTLMRWRGRPKPTEPLLY